MLEGTVDVEAIVVACVVVADPLVVGVNVERVRMAPLILKTMLGADT